MSDDRLDHIYPGIDRLYYFLGKVAMILVSVFTVIYFGPESGVFRMVSLGLMIGGVVLDVMRLRNIGVSQWFAFLRFVPYGSILLEIGLQSAQTGWVDSKRLDRVGMAIAGLYLALIIFFLFLIFMPPQPHVVF